MTDETLRAEVAWLLWCIQEGYVNPEDRAILSNWFLEDPATLSRDDLQERPHWLATADQVIHLVTDAIRADSDDA